MGTPDYLFVYGTLRKGFDHQYARSLEKECQHVGVGETQGILINIGEYPGILKSDSNSDTVIGDVYEVEDESIIDLLDSYEGVNNLIEDEYVKEMGEVLIDGEVYHCLIYYYQYPPTELEIISSGDYLSFVTIEKK
ncbi:MAG: gamma-glutamylcyclotransferase [Cyclobacteriaceae bacterium]